MLRSKTYTFMNLISLSLLVTSIIIMAQEGEHYVGKEKLWQQQSWDFWK